VFRARGALFSDSTKRSGLRCRVAAGRARRAQAHRKSAGKHGPSVCQRILASLFAARKLK